MKIVLDMNLSPDWMPILAAAGHEAVHFQQFANELATGALITINENNARARVLPIRRGR